MTKIKKLKFLIYLLLITLIFPSTLIFAPTKTVNAGQYDGYYVRPVLKDPYGYEYEVDWTLGQNAMIEGIDKNKVLNDNKVYVKVKRKDNSSISLWAEIDITQLSGVPETITNRAGEFKLNGFILADRGIVVYGLPDDVEKLGYQNEFKDGKNRYLGFDMNGQPYTNVDFPPDVVSGTHPKDKHWILRPWDDPRVQASNHGISNPSTWYDMEEYDKIANWLSEMVWPNEDYTAFSKAINDGVRLRDGTRSYNPSDWVDYFHIQSEPTDYTNGTARGWHDTYGSVYYQTFTIPALKRIEFLTIVPIEEADFTITHEGTDYTDGNIVKQLPEGTQAGTTDYSISLNVQGVSDPSKIDHIEWVEFDDPNVHDYSWSYSVNSLGTSKGTTHTVNLKGSAGGTTHAIGMIVYYKNGTRYPDGGSGDSDTVIYKNYVLHKVTITEQQNIQSSGSGEIKFTPNSSYDISGNRLGYVNKDITVTVTITGETTKDVTGSTSHGYTYSQKHSRTYCDERDEEDNCIDWDTETWYTTEHSSSSRSYTETWEIVLVLSFKG